MEEIPNNNNNNNSISINNTTPSRFSFFNRSFTTLKANHDEKPLSQNLERTVSLRGRVVQKLCSFFEPAAAAAAVEAAAASKPSHQSEDSPFSPNKPKTLKSTDFSLDLPGSEDRIVLYFTSLRGIRRTYEDCYAVRTIFRNFRVWVDERDVSMDSAYRKELMNVLGENNNNKMKSSVELPQVFIRGRYIGGVDVIKHMCEVGELGKMLEGFPRTKAGFECESCGDVRFAPCGNCSGSRKVFDEDEGLLKRCLECNENGLVRCPNCCSTTT